MLTPAARGALSGAVLEVLTGAAAPGSLGRPTASDREDAALTLWVLHELHYRGFEDVDDALEWSPELLAVRADLERDLEAELRRRFAAAHAGDGLPGEDAGGSGDADLADGFFGFVADHDGPSLARFVQRDADADQVRELLRLRSIYHLKESDPTAWVLPRLPGSTQAALMELMFDEYGAGDPSRHHAGLFARGLAASGLEAAYGAYADEAPYEILEQNNAMTMFGLQRRLRGAALGHLAAFEVTSSGPSARLVQGLDRLGFPAEMSGYYREHVEADAVHEQLAVRTICGSLVADDPALLPDVFFGAYTCLDLEDRLADTLLARWQVEHRAAVA
ncbi:iron-containing redox enzyme family protein [Nocardioides sp. KIGAM211]|uniref:Iron-containing redox enzyme family protein n=1 Tax=Nocardioides luti TaxID=2761101 RepID=A0A7X0RGA6_9ACTN|nr:iron-containing redox enzyme family protein [Nocardioides luti]MBB6627783.1 iron-containing redox enzyme family protein [Nocardioides luti]